MNKTLKTIAWICLALGLLGTTVDAGILVAGRNLAAARQTAIDTMQNSKQTGNVPNAKNTCVAEDADQDGKPDGDCLQQQAPGQPGAGFNGFGGRLQLRHTRLGMRGSLAGRRMGARGILPLFFLALGPILLLVGAVILLVNREPKKAAVKEENVVHEVKDVKEAKDQKKK